MRVARWGNSLAVRLPKAVAERAQLQEGAEIDIAVSDGRITIQRRPPSYSLDELVEQITRTTGTTRPTGASRRAPKRGEAELRPGARQYRVAVILAAARARTGRQATRAGPLA